jgi:hypothetical protein
MHFHQWNRRQFMLIGSAAAAAPLAAQAQRSERVRRVGVLTNLAADEAAIAAEGDQGLGGLRELTALGSCARRRCRSRSARPSSCKTPRTSSGISASIRRRRPSRLNATIGWRSSGALAM